MIFAVDPGPTESAWCIYDGKPIAFGKDENHAVESRIAEWGKSDPGGRIIHIEMIASYGMPVGAEVFETCVWIGRFIAAAGAMRLTRHQVKMHLCHSAKANDGTIRQAIIDRFGGKERAIGKKAKPGPLYGVSGDVWAALALAITASETTERYHFPARPPEYESTKYIRRNGGELEKA